MTKKLERDAKQEVKDSLARIIEKLEGRKITSWLMYVESEDAEGEVAGAISVDTDEIETMLMNMADVLDKMLAKETVKKNLH